MEIYRGGIIELVKEYQALMAEVGVFSLDEPLRTAEKSIKHADRVGREVRWYSNVVKKNALRKIVVIT